MGRGSLEHGTACPGDSACMREIVREAVRGGAFGYSISRTRLHTTPDGEPVPGAFAAPDELHSIGGVLGEEGGGVFEGRGVVAEAAFADPNVIDLDEFRVLAPEYARDFPAGVSCYVQRGTGIRHTLVNGRPFLERFRHTGDLAGRLLRGTDHGW